MIRQYFRIMALYVSGTYLAPIWHFGIILEHFPLDLRITQNVFGNCSKMENSRFAVMPRLTMPSLPFITEAFVRTILFEAKQ